MKRKTLKAVLRKKFDHFVKSIEDDKVRQLVNNNSIITGGCIASMWLKEKVNDYDIYFTNKETVLAVCNYYCDKFNDYNGTQKFSIIDGTIPVEDYKIDGVYVSQSWYDNNVTEGRIKIRIESAGIASVPDIDYEDADFDNDDNDDNDDEINVDDTQEQYRPVYISANAITLDNDIQLIIRFFGDAKEIHSNYDFEHCKCWWSSVDNILECPSKSLECLLARDLVYSGSKYPLASIIRSRKFINRGFTINAGQYLKMCIELNSYDLTDLNVLEDQLTGVDAYWFSEMLACVDTDKLSTSEDNSYMFELINKFF